MMMQRSQVEEHLSQVQGEEVFSAAKYVIDSVYEDKFRVLVSRQKEPIPKSAGVKGLARFDVWEPVEEDEFMIREKRRAFSEFGIRADQVEEGRVFVRIPADGKAKALEITEFVRDESKSQYLALVKKERTRRRSI